ncbi:MAG TPA: tetratricopeptide repeat-containing sensor histidine kinase [Clostridiales bacterium]|nr:tetratricopeptide repeat-containing sensor histidine kinase [Clostridiales bacterium]HQP70210.1 tetratricopeptide repeat-containing sensor histidine kinase [Clostridiales bacterium]
MKTNQALQELISDGSIKDLEKKYRSDLKSAKEKNRLDAYLGLGSLYCESKKFHEAEVNLSKALEISEGSKRRDSKLSMIYKNLGYVNLKTLKFQKAEEYLLKALEMTPEKNKRVRSFIYDALGEVFTKSMKVQKGLEYYNKALDIRKELSFWKGVSETLNKIGVNYYYQSDYDNSIKFVLEALKIREERRENRESVAACLNNLCLSYYHKGDYPKALEAGNKALKIFEKSENSETLGALYNNLGLVSFEMSQFPEALEYQFKALKIKEKAGTKAALANSYSNIGMIFTRLFNLEKALEYATKALNLRKELNDLRSISSSYNELGRIFDKQNEFEKAIHYYSESIKIKRENDLHSGLAQSLENIGMVFLKLKKYDESGECLFEAKKIYEDLGQQKFVTGIYRNISSLFLDVGKYEEALVYISRSHDLAKKYELKDKLRDSYKLLSEIYGKKGNFRKALAYYVMYSKIHEEMMNFQRQQDIGNITSKYENEKKNRENELFRLKNIELVKINKELSRSKSELIRSNSAKDKFFSIIAHDLKNPFSILYTTSELLLTYFEEIDDKKRREYINTINVSTKHLLKLIENLLEWSRSQSGLKQFNPVNFDPSEIIEGTIELIKPSADLKQIELKVSVTPDTVVNADKNMIKTVMRNLITNAVKFTKTGGQISVNSGISKGCFFFTVEDNGVGIKKKDIPKLFAIDKHFATNGTSNEKGTGLGLLLCKEFIDKHKGRMIVESSYRKGSMFGFEIPVK